jgi:hypothetical protein
MFCRFCKFICTKKQHFSIILRQSLFCFNEFSVQRYRLFIYFSKYHAREQDLKLFYSKVLRQALGDLHLTSCSEQALSLSMFSCLHGTTQCLSLQLGQSFSVECLQNVVEESRRLGLLKIIRRKFSCYLLVIFSQAFKLKELVLTFLQEALCLRLKCLICWHNSH